MRFIVYTRLLLLFKDDESQFNDTMDISLPRNVVAGSVYAVVSTVGKLFFVFVCLSKFKLKTLKISPYVLHSFNPFFLLKCKSCSLLFAQIEHFQVT